MVLSYPDSLRLQSISFHDLISFILVEISASMSLNKEKKFKRIVKERGYKDSVKWVVHEDTKIVILFIAKQLKIDLPHTWSN